MRTYNDSHVVNIDLFVIKIILIINRLIDFYKNHVVASIEEGLSNICIFWV